MKRGREKSITKNTKGVLKDWEKPKIYPLECFSPEWKAEQAKIFREKSNSFFKQHSLCIKTIPVIPHTTDTSTLPKVKNAKAQRVETASPDSVKRKTEEFFQTQLENLKKHLPTRLLENISYIHSNVNSIQRKRNRNLPACMTPIYTLNDKKYTRHISDDIFTHNNHTCSCVVQTIKQIQNATSRPDFCGLWVLLLTEGYDNIFKSTTKQENTATNNKDQLPILKKLLVCGALIEFNSDKIDLLALWALPNLSSKNMRILLHAFIPRVMLEGFMFKTPVSNLEDEGTKRLLTASCHNIVLWPRQALILMASNELLGWKFHKEKSIDQHVYKTHCDEGLGNEDCICQIPSFDLYNENDCVFARLNQENPFYGISEGLFWMHLPAKQARPDLYKALDTKWSPLLGLQWKNKNGWLDHMKKLKLSIQEEIYDRLPELPLILDKDVEDQERDELCSVALETVEKIIQSILLYDP